MAQLRKMGSKIQILNYWQKEGFADMRKAGKDFIEDSNAKSVDLCFACGQECYSERAHIIARCNGGEDTVENLHLLCRWCHLEMEGFGFLDKWDYFLWLKFKNVDNSISRIIHANRVVFSAKRVIHAIKHGTFIFRSSFSDTLYQKSINQYYDMKNKGASDDDIIKCFELVISIYDYKLIKGVTQ